MVLFSSIIFLGFGISGIFVLLNKLGSFPLLSIFCNRLLGMEIIFSLSLEELNPEACGSRDVFLRDNSLLL